MEYSKNQTLEVKITDIGDNGEGIGKVNGYTLFVKDALPGDVVRAKLTKVKKNFAYARCEEVISLSADRCDPACSEHRRCGGCQIQAMSYDAQLCFKENKVKNNLMRIGEMSEEEVKAVFEPIIGMEDAWRYRNKSSYPIGRDGNGDPVAGFYAGRTHSIIPCNNCMIAPEEDGKILEVILEHMKANDILPYDEGKGSGTVRHVLIRKAFATGQIMVCLVLNLPGRKSHANDSELAFLPGQDELIQKLVSINGMTSVCVSINNENTNVIMGNEIHTVWGSDTITDTLLGRSFEISPLSFYQVNPVQTEKLYRTAIEFANLSEDEEVWDICCGIGTISICMADHAKFVHGIEIVPEAIEDAKKNAAANGIDNIEFVCAAAEEYLPPRKDEIKADVVVFDPPRKGMEVAALDAVIGIGPSRIVYVSCDSATLARDIKYLTENGYSVSRVRCTDMFPHTVHVETVCLLERK